MVRPANDGSTPSVFSGIDPDALKVTIDSVQRDQEKLSSRASYYKLQLAYYGIGTQELTDVVHVANWARDELPLLRRRYHLAMNMDNDPYPGFKGMTSIDEARVTRAANAVAARDAKLAAELAKKDPKDLSTKEFDELNLLLATDRDEYPFAEKFAAALGPKGTLQFWEKMSHVDHPSGYGEMSRFQRGDQLDDLQKNLSLTIAQATNSDTPAMQAWKKEMVKIGDDPVEGKRPAPHGEYVGPECFIVMSNLMRYGDYDDKFLTDYGKALVERDKEMTENSKKLYGSGWSADGTINHVGDDEGQDPMTGYMKALANSPDAATKFFTAKGKDDDGKPESNFKYLFEERKWPDDSRKGKESVAGQNSMGWALEAATTGHRSGEPATAQDLKHSKEQASLFTSLINSVSADQDRLRSRAYMSDSFANAAVEYMPDLQRSLDMDEENRKKLFPTSGVTAVIGKYDTARFLHTVARNKEGYNTLNVSQHVYAAALMEQQIKHPDVYPLNQEKTVNDICYGTGLFQGIIGGGQHFQADKDDTDESARGDAWKGQVSTWGGSVVGSMTTIATAPFSGPAGVVAGGLAGTASSTVFNGLINGFGDDGGAEAKQQVYKNVKRMDHVESSTILTSQEAVKAATGSESATSEAGGETGRGFRDSYDLISQSESATSVK